MNMKIEYQANAQELSRASSLYMENQPFLRVTILFMNFAVSIMLILVLCKIAFIGFNINDVVALIGGSLWLFARRPINDWILLRRMRKSPIIDKAMTIEISLNGIVWEGKGLIPGKISWDQVKAVLETQNGFILYNTFTRFLWVPFRGFQSSEQIEALQALIREKKITHRLFANYLC